MRGSVVDLAVGVIVGGAFQAIITSLVNNIITPPIGILTGGINFADLSWTLRAAHGTTAAITLNYGLFAQNLLDFIIVAFVIFLMVKGINALRREPDLGAGRGAGADRGGKVAFMEIRDLLKSASRTGRRKTRAGK